MFDITYVADSVKGCIHTFDKSGRHITTIEDKVICPLGLHVSEDDNVYVADKASNAISVYNMLGTGGHMFDALTAEDDIKDPVAVTMNTDGCLAIAQQTFDYGSDSHAIKLFQRHRD